MGKSTPELRISRIAAAVSSSAATTGYVQTDYADNSILILAMAATAAQTVSVSLSTGTATGAAGTSVTTLTADGSNVVTSWRLQDKFSKYTYASCQAAGGTPSYTVSHVGLDLHDTAQGATGQRPTEV